MELSGLSILLAEDNPTNQLVAVQMLESLGANVTLANDGAEALEILDGTLFDVESGLEGWERGVVFPLIIRWDTQRPIGIDTHLHVQIGEEDHRLAEALPIAFEQRHQQLLLVAEVVVHGAHGGTRFFGDGVRRHRLEATLVEQSHRRLQQRAPTLGCTSLHRFSTRHAPPWLTKVERRLNF